MGGNASGFSKALLQIGQKAQAMPLKVFSRAHQLAGESIVQGSAITGAPGQPVQSGALRDSWKPEKTATTGSWFSDLVYAPIIEAGIGPHGKLTLRAPVGGFHSVKLTVAGWKNIVEYAVNEAGGYA